MTSSDPFVTQPLDDLRLKLRERFARLNKGNLLPNPLPRWWPRRATLKILVVADGSGGFVTVSFSDAYFGLATFSDTLREKMPPWVSVSVIRAHRQTDIFKPDPATEPALHERYGPHVENFRFDAPGFDLNVYDQVWFFGARTGVNDPLRLSDNELEIISRWMDARHGGVFAVGDHADFGASLCARIPRVRTMRRWSDTPSAESVAQPVPSANGANRHDTLRRGDDSFYAFNDESDTTPMRLTLKRYPTSGWPPFLPHSRPHPIMCGVKGAITVFPDHPHEGWVNDEADMQTGLNFSFGTYTNRPEYPTGTDGHKELPETVAFADVQGDHTEGRGSATGTDRNKGLVNPKRFGAVGAYDGHRSGVGRVVVDSTWHHWFDVNLTGRPTDGGDLVDPVGGTDPKAQGFNFDAAGRAVLERIQNHFTNVVVWLGSPSKQREIALAALWWSIFRYPLAEQLSAKAHTLDVGTAIHNGIRRYNGPCVTADWVLPTLSAKEQLHFEPRPQGGGDLAGSLDDLAALDLHWMELMALGGAGKALIQWVDTSEAEIAAGNNSRPLTEAKTIQKVRQLLADGMINGLQEYVKANARVHQNAMSALKDVSSMVDSLKAQVLLPK